MSDIEAVKSRLDIVDVVQSYVALSRSGQSYKGVCPFHKEKTPSFYVTPAIQRFKCFGCGEGGDVLTFIEKIERVEFGEALRIAAERAGYELKSEYSQKDKALEAEKSRIIEANTLAAKYWNYLLKTHSQGKPGRDYMQKRGIRPEEMELFQIGYAPKGTNLVPFLIKKGFSKANLLDWGLAVDRNGEVIDKFRDRLMMAIWNPKGEIVAFSGRILGPSDYAPKYLNSPETLVYHKGDVLMGLYQAISATRKSKEVILQEGNIDLLSSHKVGVANIVASGGTAITESQIKLIKRYADRVIFAFDNDQAGTKALAKALEIAEKIGIEHRTIDFGNFKDPDELISHDPNLWLEKVKNPINTVSYFFEKYQSDLDLGNPDDKSEFTRRIVPIIRSLKDPVQSSHFAGQLALSVGVSTDRIKEVINTGRLSSLSGQRSKEQQEVTSLDTTPVANRREVYLLALLIKLGTHKDLKLSPSIFSDVNAREVFEKIVAKDIAINASNLSQAAENISDGGKEVLIQVLSTEIDEEGQLEKETWKVYKSIYSDFIRSRMLELRKQLKLHPDDPTPLTELQKLTKELADLA